MSKNSILKSGSTGYDTKSDSRFVTLSRILDTKLDRHITSDISMNSNRITNIKSPDTDSDAATKGYTDAIKKETIIQIESTLQAIKKETIIQIERTLQPVVNSKVSKFGDKMDGPLDMNFKAISNIKFPTNDNDAATKGYVDSLTGNQVGETLLDLELLFRVGQKIRQIISKREIYQSELNSLIPSRMNFLTSLSLSTSMYDKYKSVSEVNARNINEISNCTMFADLKVNIVKIIENIPKDMFDELKGELKIDAVEKGVRKRFKRFLTKCVDEKYPNGISEDQQLLLDKNILLLDLGFIYFMDSVLDYLLAS